MLQQQDRRWWRRVRGECPGHRQAPAVHAWWKMQPHAKPRSSSLLALTPHRRDMSSLGFTGNDAARRAERQALAARIAGRRRISALSSSCHLSAVPAAIVRRHHARSWLCAGEKQGCFSGLPFTFATPAPTPLLRAILFITTRSCSISIPRQLDMNSSLSRHLQHTADSTRITASSSRPTSSVTQRTTKGIRRRPSR